MSSRPDAAEIFGKAIAEHVEVVRQLADQQSVLEAIAAAMTATLLGDGKILWCGHGGSAADAQHLAAESVGRFRRERRGCRRCRSRGTRSRTCSSAEPCAGAWSARPP